MISEYIDLKEENNLEKLQAPARALREGKLVLLPTETVYGIGANALDEEAVKKIFIAKGRAQDNPLIVHISDKKMLEDLVQNVGKIEKILIEKFWPGPLTIIFEKKPIIPDMITGGLDTVAIRMPSNIVAKELIKLSEVPVAAPSANISGKPSGTDIKDIIDELDGKVDFIVDSGRVDIGLESTVVRVVEDVVHILRPGKITPENIQKLGLKVAIEKQILGEYRPEEKVMSPGIKYKHYAPNSKCLLLYSSDEQKLIEKIQEIEKNQKTVILCKTKNLDKYKSENKLAMGDTLEEIIKQDEKLKYIYDENSFILKIDDNEYKLSSQIIKKVRDFIYITPKSKITIYMKKNLINEECDYPENNALYIMHLSGNLVTYGDENRTKQRHITTQQIYKGVLDNIESDKEDYYSFDITNIIKDYKCHLSINNPNNIFFTTSSLRDYHYTKQKNNAYYHIQAINLPFQNIEFYYIDKELKNE